MASFLLEYYPPFLQLINTEEIKKKLMKFGLNKSSKLVKISKKEAQENEQDLILFRNTFPNVLKTVEVKLGGKIQHEDRGVWIGWKKGKEFEVMKAKEAGGKTLEDLYNSDFAYAVKTELEGKQKLHVWKEKNPEFSKLIKNKEEPLRDKEIQYKKYWQMLNMRLKTILDIWEKVTIKNFDEQFEKPLRSLLQKDENNKEEPKRKRNEVDSSWASTDYTTTSIIDEIQSTKSDLFRMARQQAPNKNFDSKPFQKALNEIDRRIAEYRKEQKL